MRWLVATLAAFLLWAPAAAQTDVAIDADALRAYQQWQGGEHVLSFVSDIAIARNGDLDVTETIRVAARAQEMRHGIQRDFPTRYKGRFWLPTRVGFDVLSVERDGQPEPYELSSLSNGARVRIGDANRLLLPGEHVYVIRYRTNRQIAYGADSDEIYWNVNGTGWTFPIDMAEARVTLPSPAPFAARAVFTGPQGATGQDASVVAEQPGSIVFRTTKPLPAENGLTIAAAFPKGVLDPPDQMRRIGWWIQDFGSLAAALFSLLLIGGYYLWAWAKVGRDPPAGSVVPLFAPPDGLSAAACRYISRMKEDDRGFTAAIVDLAVRGRMHISAEEKGWLRGSKTTLTQTEGTAPLPAPEAQMADALFDILPSIVLEQKNYQRLQAAQGALNSGLEAAYCGSLFVRHRTHAIWGLACIPAAMLLVTWVAMLIRTPAAPLFALAGPPVALVALVGVVRFQALTESAQGKALIWAWIGLIAAIAVCGVCGSLSAAEVLFSGEWPVALPLIAIPFAIWAFSWLDAPTAQGRTMMDRIAGFRHYLGVTEERRLDTLHPPEKTPELFERYLPYAIALDVENHWAERFESVLAAAAAAGSTGHTASWYSGSNNFWDNPSSFASSVGSSLTSTVSSSASSPSSGSSSGGSSGGGGGGGGGSGW